jgi:hypothetical protein
MVGASGKEMVARLATLTINGVLMAAGKNWKLEWGPKVNEDAVTGSVIPRVTHGTFSGKGTCDAIYVSDDNWGALVSLANLDQIYTLSSFDSDTAAVAGTKTLAVSVKLGTFTREGPSNADGVVKASLNVVFLSYPTGA